MNKTKFLLILVSKISHQYTTLSGINHRAKYATTLRLWLLTAQSNRIKSILTVYIEDHNLVHKLHLCESNCDRPQKDGLAELLHVRGCRDVTLHSMHYSEAWGSTPYEISRRDQPVPAFHQQSHAHDKLI